MAPREVWIPSPHYSSRGSSITTVVLHTTEGAMKIRDLGAWFQNPSAQCSSHHGADNYEAGVLGAYVYEQNKAWTQANANPWCLSLEMCAYASWSRDTWLNTKGVLLHNAADWVAWMCSKYGIPIRALSSADAQNPGVKGVCQHRDLGTMGGNHSDAGSGFPMDKVLEWAKGGSSSGGGTQPSTGDDQMAAAVAFYEGKQYFAYINPSGKVCVNGGVVDPGSNARNGVGLAIDPATGLKVVSYTNTGGKVCKYTQAKGQPDWAWTDMKWDAK
jgi:hypothetical protein